MNRIAASHADSRKIKYILLVLSIIPISEEVQRDF